MSRLGARSALLAVLLHTSGWLTLTPWAMTLLLLPVLQAGLTWSIRTQRAPRSSRLVPWNHRLQRLYQLGLALLLGSTLLQGLGFFYHLSPGVGLPLTLGMAVPGSDDDAHLHVDTLAENR